MVSVAAVLCGSVMGAQPVQADPVAPKERSSRIAPAGKADPTKRPEDVFDPATKPPQSRVLPGNGTKIAPLTSELKPTAPKALPGAGKAGGVGLAFPGGSGTASESDVNDYTCTPSIYGSTYVGEDGTIGPYSDTIYTADVQCNFFLEYMYGISAAVDWSPYYEGEIGYVGTEFAVSGSYGASYGAFEVQGDLYDGGRQVEVILELYLMASAPWAACNPVPGLRYLLCDGLGTLTLHVVLGTGAFNTGLAPPVIRFVALGDSYSSGNGAPTNVDPVSAPACRRSTETYSWQLIAGRLPLGDRGQSLPIDRPNLRACSGARLEHLLNPQPEAGTPQLQWVSPYRTRLATITIGGNDLGFTDRLSGCFSGYCADAPLLTPADLFAIQARLNNAYALIMGSMRPDGRLIVLGYPAVLPNPDDPQDFQRDSGNCGIVNTFLSDAELRRVYEAATQINTAIATAVFLTGDSRVRYVNTLDAFRGHRVCSPDHLRWAADISFPTTSDTFHPNGAGYAEMARQIRSQAGIG
ncbi:SGNH/GDSL hydrolase family protein [Plantactinospora sp. WMMC1484]|uniref:SGNH/GDSL hydrolase family protein n=1 Tax=Plantactinospora sp. WMMC1484 TaxID=3404122 RepID=UPI003BF5977B